MNVQPAVFLGDESTAVISECGAYRYELTRRWTFGNGTCVFVMLNPSTADGTNDDPTIRKCKHFAQREFCQRLVVVNLYAYRSTSPAALFAAVGATRSVLHPRAPLVTDIQGPLNKRYLEAAIQNANLLVFAWGSHPKINVWHGRQADEYALWAEREPMCLGHSKSGAPLHPLYLANDTKLRPYRRAG